MKITNEKLAELINHYELAGTGTENDDIYSALLELRQCRKAQDEGRIMEAPCRVGDTVANNKLAKRPICRNCIRREDIYRIESPKRKMTKAEKDRMMQAIETAFTVYFGDSFIDEDLEE